MANPKLSDLASTQVIAVDSGAANSGTPVVGWALSSAGVWELNGGTAGAPASAPGVKIPDASSGAGKTFSFTGSSAAGGSGGSGGDTVFVQGQKDGAGTPGAFLLEQPSGLNTGTTLMLGLVSASAAKTSGFTQPYNSDGSFGIRVGSNIIGYYGSTGLEIAQSYHFSFVDPGVSLYATMSQAGAGLRVFRTTDESGGNISWFQDSAGGLALANNFTDATGTLANTNLSFPVVNGRTYKITGYIDGNNSTGTEGLQMTFHGVTATAILFAIEDTGFGTVVLGTKSSSAIDTAVTATTFTNGRLRLTGYVKPSATGNLVVQMAEVSHTSGTLTINAGTWINLEDMRAV